MYRASLSRTDNHTGWSVIFRHPALMDHRTGRHGRRVRYGLGTRDEAMARLLVSQLDELLADERWWTPSARAAAARFDPRVVDIFFGSLEKAQSDSREVRESLLPLPGRDSHTWVLFLGTTGAGKTTVVRQLIGTDPDDERFPTTATGRTTIADTEIISAAGSYDAAVTFFPLDEIREHLYDCILRAVVVAHRGDDRSEVRQAVLQHADQRFRFNYVLGDGRPPGAQESSRTAAELLGTDLFGPTSPAPLGMPELGVLDVAETASKIEAVVDRVLAIPHEEGKAIAEEIAAEGHEDPRVVEDLVEERLADLLRDDDEIHAMVDGLIDEMHARFDLVGDIGALSRNTQGWPESWRWSTHDRKLLLQALRRFTSNAKPGFGRLLTPLVNGVRVRGPFTPHWHDGTVPRLVLFDTEGLGHTQDSATSIPTRLTRLVDSEVFSVGSSFEGG